MKQDNRQQTTDNRQQIRDKRQQIRDNRQETTGKRQQTTDKKLLKYTWLCILLMLLCLCPGLYNQMSDVRGLLSSPCLAHGEAGFKTKFEKITLDDKTIKAINLKTQKIEEKDILETIKSTGQIEEIPNNSFDISSPVEGTVASVLVDLGDKVKLGQPVAQIESPKIAELQSQIEQFKAELELANSNFEREKSLFEKGISAKKDLDASKANLNSAEAKLQAAKSKLKIFTRHTTSSEQGTFKILARKSGTIVDRKITVGQIVNPNQILFRGIDLSKVWASADIYEKDVAKISLKQPTFITLDGLPNKVFMGKLVYIGSVINQQSRTLPVKAEINNYKEELNPGAFIKLAIHTKNKKKSITIPITALVDIEADKDTEGDTHKHIVYVKKENTFIPKEVEVATHDSNSVEVLSGLNKGDEVVTSGGYQLQYAEGDHDEHGHEKVKAPTSDKTPFGSILFIIGAVIFGLIIGLFIRKRQK